MTGFSLRGKPVAVIGASTGLFGAVWAQAELRKVLGAIGAEVIDQELAVPRTTLQRSSVYSRVSCSWLGLGHSGRAAMSSACSLGLEVREINNTVNKEDQP